MGTIDFAPLWITLKTCLILLVVEDVVEMRQRVVAPLRIGGERRRKHRLVTPFEAVGQRMLQSFDRIGIRIPVRRPHGEGEGQLAALLPCREQRVVAAEQRLAGGRNAADAVSGDDVRIGEQRNGRKGKQRDVGFPLDEMLDDGVGIGQQQLGAKVTFVPDTIDEWRRAEARHGGYTWNCDHHP